MIGWLVTAFGFVGLFRAVWLLLGVVWGVMRPSKVKSYGGWAVVTGATDGIGLGYVRQLASNGINVVLISRSQEKLDECKAKLSLDFPSVQFQTIQADFGLDTPETYQRIERGLKEIDVGILINNVGRSYDHAEYLDQVTDELVESLIRINIASTTRLTRLVLPTMLARGRGAIVNVGSAAGTLYTGDPLYAIYSATKAYVDLFSRSLHLEYRKQGISVQCQIPYFVTTKLSKIRATSFLVPNADNYAAAAIKSIGYEGSIVPFPAHALQHFLFQNVIPSFLFEKFLLGHHLGIRKAAYKKKGITEPARGQGKKVK
jgi:17beta-estradiol 17-dehydrogenase / very-long-chain 3-oxoacyl-CoA reductase